MEKEIEKLLKNCRFNANLSCENFEKNIINKLNNFKGTWSHGSTKLVLIPDNKDYVIKIPFKGQHQSVFNEFGVQEELKFYPFQLAGDYVDEWDYCAAELYKYERIKELGLEDFFVEIKKINTSLPHPIYIQKRIFDFATSVPKYMEKATREEKKKVRGSRLNSSISSSFWLIQAYRVYPKEKVDNFIAATNSLSIGDLRGANLGFLNYKYPVVVDYGGFSDADSFFS